MARGLTQGVTTRRSMYLLVGLGAVVINLPLAHSAFYDWRLDRDGVETRATVVETRTVSDDRFVEFRLDPELDPEQRQWLAQVDEAAFDRARADGAIDVRVLPDRLGTYEADGQRGSRMPWVVTLLGDAMLVVVLLVFWRARPRDDLLRLVATGDVERCRPTATLELLDDGSYVVCGEVSEIEDGAIVLEVGDRRVRVELAGHTNAVGYQQPARVTGRP